MTTLLFDLETDGLLNDLTCIHCLFIHELEADQTLVYNDQGNQEPILRGITRLEEADRIVGHNIINYDIPAIKKLYPFFEPPEAIDTLLMSRLFHANIWNVDSKKKWDMMPQQLYGRHSLKSWGYRLGVYKGCFGETSDWSEWSQEMEDYCQQDVVVTQALCKHFHPYLNGSKWSTR